MSRRGACILILVAVTAGPVASALPGGFAGAQEISVTRLQRDIAEITLRSPDPAASRIDVTIAAVLL